MRKGFIGFLTMAAAFFFSTANVMAAPPTYGHHFTDADGDGICDYAQASCPAWDEDGDGLCDLCGISFDSSVGHHHGCSYADSDNDGVCDNYTAHTHNQAGAAGGHHGRHGRCR